MEGQDPIYGINAYNMPKILSVTETYVRNVLVLLFGKPGFYPSIPTLGMDIRKYLYNFEDSINVEAIKEELVDQCDSFLPEVESGELDVIIRYYQNRPMLVFKLPIVTDNKSIGIVLGVTTKVNGELIYEYNEHKINQFI